MRHISSDDARLYSLAGGMILAVGLLALLLFGGLLASEPTKKIAVQLVEAPQFQASGK